MATASANLYSGDNHKFRKAYIRERLLALKQERDELIRERELIERTLAAEKGARTPEAPGETAPSIMAAGAGSSASVMSRFNGFARRP